MRDRIAERFQFLVDHFQLGGAGGEVGVELLDVGVGGVERGRALRDTLLQFGVEHADIRFGFLARGDVEVGDQRAAHPVLERCGVKQEPEGLRRAWAGVLQLKLRARAIDHRLNASECCGGIGIVVSECLAA